MFEVAMKAEGLAVLGVETTEGKTAVKLIITFDNDPHATKIPSRFQTVTLVRLQSFCDYNFDLLTPYLLRANVSRCRDKLNTSIERSSHAQLQEFDRFSSCIRYLLYFRSIRQQPTLFYDHPTGTQHIDRLTDGL